MSTVTVVPTVELTNVPPRVRLDVTDTGTPNLFATTVNRLDPDGVLRPVRTTDGNPLTLSTSGSDRVGLLYDYEMPYGASVSYSTVESPGTVSAAVTVDESRAWLVHPGVPALSMPITIASIGARTRRAQRGIFYPMGRSTPVVQTDGQRKAAEYSLNIYTATDDDRGRIDALFEDAGVLLLNVPASKGWGITAEYVSVGDMSEARVANFLGYTDRTWELPLVVVDRPSGGSQSQRTLADLLVYPTLADLQAAYPTLADVLAGP